MPKMRTRSAAKKRFKKLSSGKIKRACGFRRHLLTGKTSKRKRQLRKGRLVNPSDHKHIALLLPY